MTLDQLFMVKRVKVMIEFFGSCLQIAWGFKGCGAPVNFDSEYLSRPLKTFITDLLTKCISGRATYCLSLLICNLVQRDKKKGVNKYFSLDQLSLEMSTNSSSSAGYCENIFVSLEESFRRDESCDYYKKLIHHQTEYIKHVTYIISAHHWLHEEYFISTNVIPPYPRANILLQVSN